MSEVFSSLFEWLVRLPVWFQMVFASGLTYTMLYALVSLVRRGFRFGKDGVEIPGSRKKKGAHAGCSSARDIVVVLNKAINIVTKKLEIKAFSMLRRQMNYAEERIDQGIMALQGIYIDLLKKKGIPCVTSSDSFNIYKLVLAALKVELIHNVRTSFREDALDEHSESGYQAFVDNKVDTIVALVSNTLNELYFYMHDVTRDELYDANIEEANKLTAMIRDVYYYARKVAMEAADELLALDESMEELVAEIIGE